MGRNDNFSMEPVLFFEKVKRTAFMIFFICFSGLNIITVVAQNSEEKQDDKDKIQYKLKVNYDLKTYLNYKITETTNCWRQFPDSSTTEYEREVIYYVTQYVPTMPEDGFQQLHISFDSLKYKFREGDAVFEFDSQAEDLPSSNFIDLTATTVPMGRGFELFYSPYGDVAKIEGEELDWLKNFLKESAGAFQDTISSYIWHFGISPGHLSNITDIQKGVLPYGFISEDSTWESKFNIEMDGIMFTDTLRSSIIQNQGGFITVQGELDSLMPYSGLYRLYGVKNDLVEIDAGRGKGSYLIELTPRRVINFAKSEFYAEIVARVKRSRFKQKIRTKTTWELTGQFKFR